MVFVLQENKDDKMNLLYDFLASSEFRMRIEAIINESTAMISFLDT